MSAADAMLERFRKMIDPEGIDASVMEAAAANIAAMPDHTSDDRRTQLTAWVLFIENWRLSSGGRREDAA